MISRIVQTENYELITSAYDGRDVVVNTCPEKFLFYDENYTNYADILDVIYNHYTHKISNYCGWRNLEETRGYDGWKIFCAFYEKHAPSSFDEVIEFIEKYYFVARGNNGNGSRGQRYHSADLKRLLAVFRAKELIAFPGGLPVFLGNYMLGRPSPHFPYKQLDLFNKTINWAVFETTNNLLNKHNRKFVFGPIRRAMAMGANTKWYLDITPEYYDVFLRFNKKAPKSLRIVDSILRAQQHENPQKCFKSFQYVDLRRKNVRSSGDCEWARNLDPSLLPWINEMIAFLSEQTGTVRHFINGINIFLDYLLQYPELTRKPEVFFLAEYYQSVSSSLVDYVNETYAHTLQRTRNRYIWALNQFCEWYLYNKQSKNGVVHAEYINPIPSFHKKTVSNNYQTVRKILPQKYINYIISILTEDDFKWPKTRANSYFVWQNEKTLQYEKVWSPVETYALLIKLLLPLRTFQVQMLDSGEFDHEQYDHKKGTWYKSRKNPVGRQNGVLRRIEDISSGQDFIGLYINTNKTADLNKADSEKGYVIPWQNEDVIKHICELREFQKKYNKVLQPLKITEIRSNFFGSKWSQKMKSTMHSVAFLFRDPRSQFNDEPVSSGKILKLWGFLLEETENRLFLEGERLHNGNRIKLVEVTKKKPRRLKALYDLHSLRASLITSLFNSGVPPRILSKFVAGHSTILMTLYYEKTGISHITNLLNNKSKSLEESQQKAYANFLKDQTYEHLESHSVVNDKVALVNAIEQDSCAWAVTDLGICPVAMSKCNEGGQIVHKLSHRSKYSAVPNGPANCFMCRFFITGPHFVIGLSAKFNEIGVQLIELRDSFLKIEKKIAEAESIVTDDASAFSTQGENLDYLYNQYEKIKNNLDFDISRWHTLYSIIKQCLALLDAKTNTKKNQLMVSSHDAVKMVLEDSRYFDLIDSICQTSEFYKLNVDASKAQLRRGQVLDALLTFNEKRPIFIHLKEDIALKVGNEMVKFLMNRIGQGGVHDLLDGKRSLNELGLSEEVEKLFVTPHTPAAITHKPIDILMLGEK